MTTFADGVYQFGGSPVSGQIPATYGTVYFCDYDNGNDAYDGKSMDGAVKTMSQANTNLTTNKHDLVLLSGVSSHVLTSMLSISKNRTHWIGLEGGGRKFGQGTKVSATITSGATNIATMQNTGVRNSFRNIKFMNASTVAQGLYSVAEGGEYTVYDHCEFYKSTDLNETSAAEFLAEGDSTMVYNCTFGSLVNAISGAINRPCIMFDRGVISGKVARDNYFADCLFWRKGGNAGNLFIEAPSADDAERMILFERCQFINNILGTTMNNVVESALTNAHMLFIDCNTVNTSSWATSTTNAGVYVNVHCAQEEGASDATNFQGLMVQAT